MRRLHGHSYRVRIYVQGELDPELGWVMDFGDIKKAYLPVREQLDHYLLNDIDGLDNPTAESIARWIWQRLKPSLPTSSKIETGETCTSGCVYTGD